MAHGHEVKAHVPQLHRIAAGDGAQCHPVQQLVLAQLVFHQGQREGRTVDMNAAQLGHQPGQRADMILVPVGEHNAQQLVPHGLHRAKMRNDHVHAQMKVIGKHEAAVHHHHPGRAFPELAVEADFAQTAQRGDGQKMLIRIHVLSLWPRGRRRRTRGRRRLRSRQVRAEFAHGRIQLGQRGQIVRSGLGQRGLSGCQIG